MTLVIWRKKIVKEPFMEKVKWKRLKLKSSIYAVCTILFVISLVAIIIICCNFSTDSIVYGVGNSLFTGIIASIIVSVIIQIKQDKEQFEKKRAILFDAGFFLKNFQNNYQERKKNNSNIDEDWREIFDLCEEPARYLSELYQSGLDILDVVDISIIRRINSSYKFILEIKSGFSNVKNHITGLASQAVTWGKDLVMGLVNGIKSCIGAVGDAVKSVADKIKSFLHFSVPDEGPLTDYESWMPDFMGGLAKGIEKSRGLVADAVNGVAEDMVVSPTVSANAVTMQGSFLATESTASIVGAIREAFAGISTQGGDTVIPVYIGGTMLAIRILLQDTQRFPLPIR